MRLQFTKCFALLTLKRKFPKKLFRKILVIFLTPTKKSDFCKKLFQNQQIQTAPLKLRIYGNGRNPRTY